MVEVVVETGWVVLRPGMMAYRLSSRVEGASQEQGGRSKKQEHPNSFMTWYLFFQDRGDGLKDSFLLASGNVFLHFGKLWTLSQV